MSTFRLSVGQKKDVRLGHVCLLAEPENSSLKAIFPNKKSRAGVLSRLVRVCTVRKHKSMHSCEVSIHCAVQKAFSQREVTLLSMALLWRKISGV